MKDVAYWEARGLYVIVDFEGKTIRNIDIQSKDPGIKPQCSDIGMRMERYLKTGVPDFSGYMTDLTGYSQFQKDVLAVTSSIPAGKTMTYAEVAAAAGRPKAARAAGNAVGRNPTCIIIPCHRVVASNGGLGGFTGDIEVKKALLRLEGAL